MNDFKGADHAFGSGPPKLSGVQRIEHLACQQVLRLSPGINPGWVMKQAGLSPSDSLTFHVLNTVARFGVSPSITDTPPDPIPKLLTDARNTAIWKAWVTAWDDRPDVAKGSRVLVAEGGGWERVVIHDDVARIDSNPGLVIIAGRTRLVLELIKPWASHVWKSCDIGYWGE